MRIDDKITIIESAIAVLRQTLKSGWDKATPAEGKLLHDLYDPAMAMEDLLSDFRESERDRRREEDVFRREGKFKSENI